MNRLLCCCLALCAATPGEIWAQRPDRRPIIAQGDLTQGDPAPDFELPALDGKTQVKLSSLRGKPVVLIFGSCTCPPFVASMQATSRLYETYKDRAHFLLVYIREAHPTDGWKVPGNQFEVASPKTTEARLEVAREFAKRLNISIPIVADTTEDRTDATYAAWPNRMYILDAKGNIADAGRAGPDGTAKSAQRASAILESLLTSAP